MLNIINAKLKNLEASNIDGNYKNKELLNIIEKLKSELNNKDIEIKQYLFEKEEYAINLNNSAEINL